MKAHSLFHRWLGTASTWFARMRRGDARARTAKFHRWLTADPANQLEYAKRELAWELAGELARDPNIADWLAEAQNPPRDSRRTRLVWAVAMSLCAAGALSVAYLIWPTPWEQYTTRVGERRTIVLADESRIELNTDTRIRVIYGRKTRRVELERGEATFRVARNPSRPFEVWSHGGVARALGTEFNVLSLFADVTVTVLSGKVEVLAATAQENVQHSDGVVLLSGQELSYSGTTLSHLRGADTQRVRAWQSGRVAFEDVRLAEALAEFNRYTSTPVVIQDPALEHIRVSGVFRIGETDALLNALHTAFGIEAAPSSTAIELRAGDLDSTPR